MYDMLVRLYQLPDIEQDLTRLTHQDIIIRRPGPYERHIVIKTVSEHFSAKWASEVKTAFTRQPISCFIATQNGQVLGFACYDVTSRGFFGPTGVLQEYRHLGIGKSLLVTALRALYDMGYAYAIIGGVGPGDFYAKTVDATVIENSSPGIYVDILPEPTE